MVALITPATPASSSSAGASEMKPAHDHRLESVSPPRIGPEARPRSGRRGRADLRLVVDNTSTGSSLIGGSSTGFDKAVGVVEQGGETALDHLMALLARPISEVLPRWPAARGVDYSVGLILLVALLPIVAVLGIGLVPGAGGDDGGAVPIASASSLSSPAADGELRVVVVQPGDTLWSIAGELAPGEDPRHLVSVLGEANGGDQLQVGQRLVVPDGALGS